jgi:hypothetical protein
MPLPSLPHRITHPSAAAAMNQQQTQNKQPASLPPTPFSVTFNKPAMPTDALTLRFKSTAVDAPFFSDPIIAREAGQFFGHSNSAQQTTGNVHETDCLSRFDPAADDLMLWKALTEELAKTDSATQVNNGDIRRPEDRLFNEDLGARNGKANEKT